MELSKEKAREREAHQKFTIKRTSAEDVTKVGSEKKKNKGNWVLLKHREIFLASNKWRIIGWSDLEWASVVGGWRNAREILAVKLRGLSATISISAAWRPQTVLVSAQREYQYKAD